MDKAEAKAFAFECQQYAQPGTNCYAEFYPPGKAWIVVIQSKRHRTKLTEREDATKAVKKHDEWQPDNPRIKV